MEAEAMSEFRGISQWSGSWFGGSSQGGIAI